MHFYLFDEIGYIKVIKLDKNYQTSEKERLILVKDHFVEEKLHRRRIIHFFRNNDLI